jgi:hypothetical protein
MLIKDTRIPAAKVEIQSFRLYWPDNCLSNKSTLPRNLDKNTLQQTQGNQPRVQAAQPIKLPQFCLMVVNAP